jgi:BirA family biotin operon repressor/biotin-[acetyl-CoA-carboxylase] ligase
VEPTANLPDPDAVVEKMRSVDCPWPAPHAVATTESTNIDASAALMAGAETGLCFVAGEQTAGRGRQGRTWVSDPGAGLWCSTVIRDFPDPGRLPLLAGLAVIEAAVALNGPHLSVKWPNDVLASDGRKMAGILVEARPDGAVIGIGINVDHSAQSLPVEHATSWRLLCDNVPDRSTLLAALLASLHSRLNSDWSSARESYRAMCSTVGHDVVVEFPGGETLTGRAIDIDGEGHLLVKDGQTTRIVVAGDVVHATIAP